MSSKVYLWPRARTRRALCRARFPTRRRYLCSSLNPRGSTAAVTRCTQAPSDGVEVSTFESQPALSRADTSCFAEARRAEEAQSVFESNPAATVVDVSSTTVEEGTSAEPSVFESTPAPSFAAAAVTWETQVTEASDGQSVFENQPLVSRVDTSCHGEQIRTEEVQSVLKPRGCLAAGRHPQDIARLVPTRLAEESAGDSRDTRTGCGEGGALSSRDPRRGRARGQRSHRHQSQKPTSAATATSSVSTEQPDDFVFGNQPAKSDVAVPCEEQVSTAKGARSSVKGSACERLDQTSHRYAFQPSVWISATEPTL